MRHDVRRVAQPGHVALQQAVDWAALQGPARVPHRFNREAKLDVADFEGHGPGLLAILRELARLGQIREVQVADAP